MTPLLQQTYRYSWISLLLIYPAIFFMTPSRAVVLFWLPLLAGWRWMAHNRPIPKTSFNPAILLLTIMIAVSAWATPDLAFSLPKIAGLLFGIAVFYMVVDLNTLAAPQPQRNNWTITALLLLAGGFVLVGFVNFYPPLAVRLPSILHFEVNPNEVSGILTYSWPLLVALTVWHIRQQGRTAGQTQFVHSLLAGLMSVAGLIGVGILYLTTSRGGQVACLAAVGLIAIFSTRRLRAVMLGGSVVLLLAAGVYLMQAVPSAAPAEAGSNANATLQLTLANRTELWERGVKGIQDFPLTGMGMNIFRRAMPELYPLEAVSAEFDFAHAHNHLLQAALDLGVPGLFAYLWIWILAAWQLLHTWRTAPSPRLRFLALGIAASLLAHFLFGITDAIALGAKPGFLLWMLFGVAASLPTTQTTT